MILPIHFILYLFEWDYIAILYLKNLTYYHYSICFKILRLLFQFNYLLVSQVWRSLELFYRYSARCLQIIQLRYFKAISLQFYFSPNCFLHSIKWFISFRLLKISSLLIFNEQNPRCLSSIISFSDFGSHKLNYF